LKSRTYRRASDPFPPGSERLKNDLLPYLFPLFHSAVGQAK
jgi:hypothetical protein